MRDEILRHAKRIVVKIGSSLIASRATGLRPEQIERLADEIAALRTSGRDVLVVSSGAIVSGIKKLQLKEYPKSLPIKQAAAAVGQSRLMWAYEKAFERLGTAPEIPGLPMIVVALAGLLANVAVMLLLRSQS